MRILFTNTGSWGTGAGNVIEGLSVELAALGHDVKIVFPDAGLPSADREKYYGNPDRYHIIRFPVTHQGVTFETFPLMITDPNPRSTNAKTYKDLSDKELTALIDLFKGEFVKVIDDFKPDIVETEHVWLMGYVFSKLGAPYVVGAHNSDQMGFRYDKRMQSYAKECAQKARCLFSINESAIDELSAMYDIPREKIIYIPNGYDQKLFQPKKLDRKAIFDRYGIHADPTLPIITCVAKLSKTKGIDTLIEANAVVQNEHPCTILVFGSGNLEDVYPDGPPLPSQLTNIRFMGHQIPEIIAEYNNIADLSVLPSRSEGFGVAALEAMGCGVPVIATDVGQMGRFVVGDVIKPDDAHALAQSIIKLLALPAAEMKALSTEAREQAQTYSWHDIALKRLEYYRIAFRTHR